MNKEDVLSKLLAHICDYWTPLYLKGEPALSLSLSLMKQQYSGYEADSL